ncbi:hypothetical protein ACFQ0M_14520 [Kitasatospora aburaviensis]
MVDERTESTTTWINPDGTTTLDMASGPVRYKDGSGKLQPIDIDLAKQPDGSVKAKGHPLNLSSPAPPRPPRRRSSRPPAPPRATPRPPPPRWSRWTTATAPACRCPGAAPCPRRPSTAPGPGTPTR